MRAKKTSYTVMLILCFAIAILWIYVYTENRTQQESLGFLEHEWIFAVNGEVSSLQPDDVLASYIFPKVQKGDVVTMESFNKDSKDFYLSAACGIATSQEADSPKAVMELADQRMYEKKNQMKEKRNGIL